MQKYRTCTIQYATVCTKKGIMLLWPKNFESRIYANTNRLCTQDRLYTWQKVEEEKTIYAQETDAVTKSGEYSRSLSKILNWEKGSNI